MKKAGRTKQTGKKAKAAVASAKKRVREFRVSHGGAARFATSGLRNYFEYRDLGIKAASRGKVVSHVIRARPGEAPHGE